MELLQAKMNMAGRWDKAVKIPVVIRVKCLVIAALNDLERFALFASLFFMFVCALFWLYTVITKKYCYQLGNSRMKCSEILD